MLSHLLVLFGNLLCFLCAFMFGAGRGGPQGALNAKHLLVLVPEFGML
jgi:hypothetical protein